jgi:23S rRNA (adenine2503-C2)-methyltransferase
MLAFSDHDVSSLSAELTRGGHNPANAPRILRAYWGSNGEFDISSVPIARSARATLQPLSSRHSRVILRHESRDGTIKFLVGFVRGGAVECVLMPSHRPDRAAVCLSSQIGCAMGCDFCASTKSGLQRNLGVGEIVEQFIRLRAEARTQRRRIASLVFMGMGEPMHNLDNVIRAIRLLAEPGLGALGRRAITVSTVGIVPGIDRLADHDLGVHLALSLHAPDDATRSRLVPSNRRWSVSQIMDAAKRFQSRTSRPVNIEYCMLGGVNDSDEQADLLANLMDGFRAHVNLIPYNPIGAGVSGTSYRRPGDERVDRFARRLRHRNVVVHIRQTRGDDVAAACGQLRIIADREQHR